MSTIPSDAYRGAAAPHDAHTTLRTLDLDASGNASIALVTGLYELRLIGELGAFVCPGADTTSLAAISSGAPEQTGFYLAPGDVVTYWHDATFGDGELHAIPADTGTCRLVCTRKGGA